MSDSVKDTSNKILPLLIGLAVLVGVIILGVFFLKSPGGTVDNLMITNIADTSATVVWTTKEPSQGVVYISNENEWRQFALSSKEKFWDTRDIEQNDEGDMVLKKEGAQNYYTHHVTVSGLEPETEYFLRVGDGGMQPWSLAEGESWPTIRTGPTLELPVTPNTVYGKVVDEAGNPITDAIVTIQLQNDMDIADSTVGSAVLAQNGTYTLEISNLRSLELDKVYEDKFIYNEKIEVIGPFGYEKVTTVVYPELDQPVPDIKLTTKDGGEVPMSFDRSLVQKVQAAGCSCSCNGAPGSYSDRYCGKLGESSRSDGGKCYVDEKHCNALATDAGQNCNSDHEYTETKEVTCSGGATTSVPAPADTSPASQPPASGGGSDWAPGVTGAQSCSAPKCWSDYTSKCYQSGLRMGCGTCNYCCNGSAQSSACGTGGGGLSTGTPSPGVSPILAPSVEGGDATNCDQGRTTTIANTCPGDKCGNGGVCGNATCDYCDCGDQKDVVPPGGTCHIEERSPITAGTWGPCGVHPTAENFCCEDNLWTSDGAGAIMVDECTKRDLSCQAGACVNPAADFSGITFRGNGSYCIGNSLVWADSVDGKGKATPCPMFCCGAGPGAKCLDSCTEAPGAIVCENGTGCDGQSIGNGEYPGTTYTLRCSDNTVKTYICGTDGTITMTESKEIKTPQEAAADPSKYVSEAQAAAMVGVHAAERTYAMCPTQDVTVPGCSSDNKFTIGPQESGTTAKRPCKEVASGSDIVATWTCNLNSTTGVASWSAPVIETATRAGCAGGTINVYTREIPGASVRCTLTAKAGKPFTGAGCWINVTNGAAGGGCNSPDKENIGSLGCSGTTSTTNVTVQLGGCTGMACSGSATVGGGSDTVTCSYPVLTNGETGEATCTSSSGGGSVTGIGEAGKSYKCVDGSYQPVPAGSSSQSWLYNFVSPAKAQEATEETSGFQGPGVYKISISGYDVTTESIKIVEVDEEGNPRITFFDDKNSNGIKDEGEEDLDISYDLLSITQTEAGEDFRLNIGWNLISIPLLAKDEVERTAGGLLRSINTQGIYATQIAKYYKGQWVLYTYRSDTDEVYGTDFQLIPGEAYFIRSYQRGGFVLTGNKYDQSVPVELIGGWNLISVVSPEIQYTADSLLSAVSSTELLRADTVSSYSDGSYTSVVKKGGILYGNDFKILEKKGYFVRVEEGGSGKWQP